MCHLSFVKDWHIIYLKKADSLKYSHRNPEYTSEVHNIVSRNYAIATLAAITISVLSIASLTPIFATGNGAPSGTHYNLNLIGLDKGGSASTTNNGHVIFVSLWGNCKILLQEGPFAVIDSNCIGSNAAFQLPNPNDTSTGMLAYSVWVRALTKGSSTLTTCFTDVTTGSTFCNTGSLVVSLSKVTPPKFTDVSKQLLQVCVNGQLSALFSNANFNYFWNYTNTGLHLAQLRFYPIETTASGGTC